MCSATTPVYSMVLGMVEAPLLLVGPLAGTFMASTFMAGTFMAVPS